jgi:uncharacterized protein YdaU (DUF1376 family)
VSLPYFPLYPTDFEADTSHLTLAEDGAYNRLLRLCWMTPGCSLPNDEAWILRRMRARTDGEIEAVRVVLAEFFTAANGRFSNARLTREFHAAKEAHERRKNAGAKGGAAKHMKINETRSSNAKAKPKQPEPEPEPEPDIRDTNVSLRARCSRYSEEFDHWWKIYPRKKNKGEAFKAFQKAKKIVGADRLFSALLEQLPFLEREAQRDGGQYCPHPASWLNAGSYDDDPPKPQTNLMTQIANGEYDPWTNASENVLPLSQARLPRD